MDQKFVNEYLMWRRLGLRAWTAFYITKHGWEFMMDFLMEGEK